MAQMVIVGSGVVGQATGKGFAKKGHHIQYVDVDPQTITTLHTASLSAGTIEEVNWDDVDIVIMTVATPSVNGRTVLDQIEAAARHVGEGLARTDHYVIVVVRSTVPPTTTEERIIPILERASGKLVGVDFGVAMNPEFLRQTSSEQDFARPWVTVIGSNDPRTLDFMRKLYKPFGALIVECTPTEAEMIKYVNNIYNAVKISYFNEVDAICQKLGVDSNLISAVVARSAEGIWNPLYGTRGGAPYGGACLPKDTSAFMGWLQERGWEHLMLEATIEMNRRLENKVPSVASVDKIEEMLTAIRRNEESTDPDAAQPARIFRENAAHTREILDGVHANGNG
jgi:UDPglucose 6-dehydrogenase